MVLNEAKRIYRGEVPQDGAIQGSELVWERSYDTPEGLAAYLENAGTVLRLPTGTTYLGDMAFYRSEIDTVVVPASVQSIHQYAFSSFRGSTVIFNMSESRIGTSWDKPAGLTVIWKGDDPAAHEPEGAADAAFSAVLARTVETLEIPRGVRFLRPYALTQCRSMTAVHVPRSVRRIEQSAFWECTALSDVYLEAGVKVIGNAFSICTSLGSLTIPATVRVISGSAFRGSGAVNLTIHRPPGSIAGSPWASTGTVTWTAGSVTLPPSYCVL